MSALVLLLGVVLTVAAPALAQEDSGDEGYTPAVQLEDQPEQEVLADWTYRYVIPTGLALAAVVILMTSIRYFTNVVRKRYRIVQE
ncbi:MAG: hypothetical protein R3258_10525 [Acidimicrobiia bacterium]|nr:hypothetical protein [Acidimicrobiia bacterium]